MEQVSAILRQRGQSALETSKRAILKERINHQPLQEALYYFIDEVWPKILHPGLLSIYCEAVGGDPKETMQVGAAMVLLVGAADLHDDIIDQSKVKNFKPTVFGKFGKDIAILAGDALLIEGMYLLHSALEGFPKNKRTEILELVKQAFFDLSSAEADEAVFRGSIDLPGEQYLEIIKKKVAVAEATAKIGAILGDGTVEQVETLADYGRTLGLLLTIRDEFIDVFESDELVNRARNEILPLPVLYAFQDPTKKDVILQLLKGRKLTSEKTDKIVDIVTDANETQELKREMKRLVQRGLRNASSLEVCGKMLELLLESTVEDLL